VDAGEMPYILLLTANPLIVVAIKICFSTIPRSFEAGIFV